MAAEINKELVIRIVKEISLLVFTDEAIRTEISQANIKNVTICITKCTLSRRFIELKPLK